MSVDINIPSAMPTSPGLQVYSFVGTAVTFSVNQAVAYAGLGLQNPASSTFKLTVLKAGIAPSAGAAAGVSIPIGWGKLIAGTAALGSLSAVTGFGVITSPYVSGTTTGSGLLFGTATVLNGTAAAGLNALNHVTVLGGIAGTAVATLPTAELCGEATLMPGESGCILAQAAVTGFPFLVWAEQPIK